ncbi:hypothetical protein DPMN_066568 [Dreissena polymorpha]|uniref:Uncharacterized protein n=1 Tax=Dreissena polymorpha TaxID=45954 RepID=A0A9D3YXL8_DREPO|nr:hypothetical protein DPMN_066568 [Dreissena polymorpha]
MCRGIDDGSFMIACDVCEEWLNGKCVGVTEEQGEEKICINVQVVGQVMSIFIVYSGRSQSSCILCYKCVMFCRTPRVVGRIDGRDIYSEVEEASGRGTLWSSGRDLVIELRTMLPLDNGRVERTVEGQVSLARRKGRLGFFVAAVRKYGHQILSDSFIKRVLAGPEKQRRTPGASLSGRPRCKVEQPKPRPKPTQVPTTLDFPAMPARMGSEEVKVEQAVESLVPNPISLYFLVLSVGS